MAAYSDFERQSLDECNLDFSVAHSCDGDVLRLTCLLLLAERRTVTEEHCLQYCGGYGSMYTKHFCESKGCTKGGYRGDKFVDLGFVCAAHGGGYNCQMEGCKNKGYLVKDSASELKYLCFADGGGQQCERDGCLRGGILVHGSEEEGGGPRYRCKKDGGGHMCEREGCKTAALLVHGSEEEDDGPRFRCSKDGGGHRCERGAWWYWRGFSCWGKPAVARACLKGEMRIT
jgi:hypothetical protein